MSNVRKRRQRGITMVESLVALVVMSIGMLGIASLYVTSLKTGRSALVRTQAVNLATDIADRIRSNRAGKGGYETLKYGTDLEAHDCVVKSTCTAAELAEDDLFRWTANLKTFMPDGTTGTVEFKDNSGALQPNRYTITVAWSEFNEDKPSTTVLVVDL